MGRTGARRRRPRGRGLAAGTLMALATTALAAQLVADDLISTGAACLGLDCVNNEVFGFDTVRLKENNLRITFRDTTDPAAGPTTDWRITANASANGGRERFSIDDLDAPVVPFRGVDAADVTSDSRTTRAVGLGDMNGDGLMDVVAGNAGQPNRLYLNDGTRAPFAAVTGSDVSADSDVTTAIALGDLDNDAQIDVVAGNSGSPSRVYLNAGTFDPFAGVVGSNVGADSGPTTAVALGDVNLDFRLDLIVGNAGQPNRLFLNDGAGGFPAGTDITGDGHVTTALALGDVNGDSRIDLVVGNRGQPNRLYLSDGVSGFLAGSDVGSESDPTTAVALGDVNGDGFLDVVVGNDGAPNRVYLNTGTPDPFGGVAGTTITGDAHPTTAIVAIDLSGDGFADVLVGNDGGPNRAYVSTGTADPFAGVIGVDIGTEARATTSLAMFGPPVPFSPPTPFQDLVVGNRNQPNQLFFGDDDDTGTSPLVIEGGTATDAIRVTASGRVGLGTATPDPGAALDVRGDVRVVGDLQVVAGTRGGVVPASAFTGRTASVAFATPYAADYAIVLSAVSRRSQKTYKPTVLTRDANGFTFTRGGRRRDLVEVHWTTRLVGEY